MKKAYIIKQKFNERNAIVCYLNNYNINNVSWVIYLEHEYNGHILDNMAEPLFDEIEKLQLLGYEFFFSETE